MNIDPEQEGVRAYNEGLDLVQNPYEDDAQSFIAWEAGWYNAYELDFSKALQQIKVGKTK